MITFSETPLYEIENRKGDGNHLFVKRDDLLPFSLGGNKVRIAQEFLADMKAKRKTAMIIYGDSRSNLCRVLANLCHREDIPCYMICTSVHSDGGETNNSRIMEWLHTTIVPCEKNAIAPAVDETMELLKARGYDPYYIYGNRYGTGNEGVAARAYAKAYGEICSYEQERGIDFDYIFCPSGTGATHSGLVCGSLQVEDKRKIVGISVARDAKRGAEILKQGIESYFTLEGKACPEHFEDAVCFTDKYVLEGYGCANTAIYETIRREYEYNGLPLDPTYTGKAFWGMQEYLQEHEIRDKNILFLHTGGIPLFFDFLQGGKETC
ncbi:MAG: pyridoxal-phosphate dependent enzyme [Lachnospiraceae bacterium]|nr:pyridoxal-phosphate dependent enzyme [Lachnospiraceae bacterium]